MVTHRLLTCTQYIKSQVCSIYICLSYFSVSLVAMCLCVCLFSCVFMCLCGFFSSCFCVSVRLSSSDCLFLDSGLSSIKDGWMDFLNLFLFEGFPCLRLIPFTDKQASRHPSIPGSRVKPSQMPPLLPTVLPGLVYTSLLVPPGHSFTTTESQQTSTGNLWVFRSSLS